METTDQLQKQRERTYVAVACHNCDGNAWVHALSFGATSEDYPLKPHWQEMTIPNGKYLPVDNGFCLDLTGHYDGFTDDISGDLSHVVLCHDCSVALARALPGVFGSNIGHHGIWTPEFVANGGASCCEFASYTDDNGCHLIGDGNGGWIKKYDSDGNPIS